MTVNWEWEESRHWIAENADRLDEIADLEKLYALERSHYEHTPLEMAVLVHRRDVVDALIQRGAKTDTLEKLLYRSDWKFEDIDELCYQRGVAPSFAMLARAVRENNAERLNYLIEKGGDPDPYTRVGVDSKTPSSHLLLELAISHASIEIVKRLLQWKFTLASDAIPHAVRRDSGSLEMTQFLLDEGAKVDATALSGYTSLVWLSCGIRPVPRDKRGPLIAMLLEYGAAPDATDERGTTSLMHESGRGETGIMRLLLSHGADWRIRNNDGLSAMDVARKTNRPEAIALLVSLPA